ncbi:MAG: aminotransferase class IV [Gemmatimonadales bacterium]|nr:aminotransferase class IV [Gemmatimonadales bacterium]
MTALAATLIETVRVIGGRAPLWPLHRSRLDTSAVALGIVVPPLEPPVGGEDRVVRYAVSGDVVRITESSVEPAESLAFVSSAALHRGYPHKVAARAWLNAERLLARAGGADDAIMMDGGGMVVEATIWAVGWWDGDRLLFPPLARGGLPSVARARLAEVVRGGIGEGDLAREKASRRPLVACNAARGVVAVAALDGVGTPMNHRTLAISKRFWDRDCA